MLLKIAYLVFLSLSLFVIAQYTIYKAAQKALFFPRRRLEKDPSLHEMAFEDVFLRSDDGVTLHGWYIPHPHPVATLLFFHGNSGNIGDCVDEFALWHRIGMEIFAIDYRGFGRSSGSPSELGFYEDAKTAYRHLIEEKKIPAQKIICFGRSLGGAVAIHLASVHSCAAVIVSSTFTSIQDLISVLFSRRLSAVLKFVNPMHFCSVAHVGKLDCSLLVLHGVCDKIVPFSLGKKLYDAAPGAKMWYSIADAGHNNSFILGGKRYWYLIEAFIAKAVRGEQ